MQALLINKFGNKNHLKNINDQNFAHFKREGYDKGFYGIQFKIVNSHNIFKIVIIIFRYFIFFRIKVWFNKI